MLCVTYTAAEGLHPLKRLPEAAFGVFLGAAVGHDQAGHGHDEEEDHQDDDREHVAEKEEINEEMHSHWVDALNFWPVCFWVLLIEK